MVVASLRLEVRIAATPWARRRTVRSIVAKLRRHFNVSVAEADRPGQPDDSLLVIATVATHRREVRETLDRVADALAAHPRLVILRRDLAEH